MLRPFCAVLVGRIDVGGLDVNEVTLMEQCAAQLAGVGLLSSDKSRDANLANLLTLQGDARIALLFRPAPCASPHAHQFLPAEAIGLRSCIAVPERSRRDWSKVPEAKTAGDNRRRIRGLRGRCLMRQRGELIERSSLAHLYNTVPCAAPTCAVTPNILKRR